MKGHTAFVSALLAVLSFVCPAIAQDAASSAVGVSSERDAVVAQSLFERGRELMEEGDYAQACPLLAESQKLDPGGGTLLNLGICYEREGRLATAYSTLNRAVSQAIRDGRDERQAVARERLDAIRPRLSKIVVIVSDASRVPGLSIRLDGVALGRAAWGTGSAADRGEHEVLVEAPGHEPWRTRVNITDEASTSEVRVPVLTPAASAKRPEGQPVFVHIDTNITGLALVRIDSFSQRPTVCRAPCDKSIHPGWRFRFRQGRDWVGDEFPIWPEAERVTLRANLIQEKRPGRLVAGIVSASVGGVAIIVSALVALASATTAGLSQDDDGASPFLLIPIGVGAVAVGGGIVLIVTSGADYDFGTSLPPRPKSALPAPTLGLSTTF